MANDSSDIFDSVVSLDDSHLHQGFDEGFRDGLASGRLEGREIGLRLGFQRGEEIGFYQGCTDIWKEAISRCPNAFSVRCQKNIGLFVDQLKVMSPMLEDHRDERLQDMMEMIRARFRAILSMLSVHIHYEGYPGGGISSSSSSSSPFDHQDDRTSDF